jgi:putative hydrolase of the HAD superfamily
MTAIKASKAITAIIFDFGGVLMRTENPIGRREWEERLGLPKGELERVVHQSGVWMRCQRGQVSPEDYWREVGENLRLAPDELPKLRADYFRDDRLDPALIALIKTLRGAGYRVGLLSNDSPLLEAKLRDELAIYDLFDAVVISAQIGVMKPDPGAYQAIMERLNVAPEACLFIDDAPNNIDGATAAGMTGIPYRAGMDLSAALQSYGVNLA